MNNIFQYRETRDVVYDTYKRVEEMSAVLSKLGLFRGQFAGGVAITSGNRIFFQNTSGHGHWSILATEGDDSWRFHDVLTGSDLLTFYKNFTVGLFNNSESGDRYLVLGHPTTSHTLVWDDFYINLKHGKVDRGRINIGWESDDETYTRWYPSNSGYSNHIIDKALEVRQIAPTVAGTTTNALRHRVQQGDGTSNYAAYIAQAGADTECFYIMKYATSHSSNPGRVSFWNQSNTDMLFLNNSTEYMRLTSGGNLCLGVTSTSGRVDIATNNGSSNYTRMTMFQARVTTSNATPTTLWSYTPTAGRTVMLEARVVARRTAGGGSAGDGAGYVVRAAYGITTGPTTTLFGTVDQWVREAVAGYDATFVIDGSNNIVLQVTGVAGTDISWQANVYLDIIGG